MKKLQKPVIGTIICLVLSLSLNTVSAKVKMNKIQEKMETKALKLRKNGAAAVIGIAVSDPTRPDIGKRKAIAASQQELAEASRALVEASAHIFMEEIGVGQGNELNDVMKNTIETTSSKVLRGAMVEEFQYYQTKPQKKDNSCTYLVLYVINPKTLYKSFEMGLKESNRGSEENLYQRYVDSEAKKEHDEKIKKFEENFGAE